MNFNFPAKEGTGIDRLIPNAPPECVELIKKLLAYNPDERYANFLLCRPFLTLLVDYLLAKHYGILTSGNYGKVKNVSYNFITCIMKVEFDVLKD